MADEKIRLGLDLGDSVQQAKQLGSSLGGVKGSAQDVAQTYEVLVSASTRYKVAAFAEDDAIDDLIIDLERADAATRRLATAKRSAAEAFDRATGSTKNYTQELLAVGRITQDFAQGGVGGILNNIEGLLIKFPLLASAATVAATALYVGGPIIKDWFTAWRDGSNQIPDFVEGLDKLTAAIKSNKEWIDKASEKGYLTDDELTEFNARVAENTQLEKDSAEAKKAKAAAEQLAAVKTKEASETAAEASRILKEELAGRTDDVIQSVESRMTTTSDELRGAVKLFDETYKEYSEALDGVTDVSQINAINEGYTRQLDKLNKIQAEIKQRIASDAANLVGEAVLKGNQEAIDKIAKLGGKFGDTFKGVNKQIKDQIVKEAEEDAREMVRAIEAQEEKVKEANRKFTESIGKSFIDDLRKQNEAVRKQIEEFNRAEADDPLGQAKDIIRDVEYSDFFTIDRNGREQGGLGMTSKQVEEAAKAGREFQRTHGLDDRTAAQMAIQEQLMLNQRMMADRENQAAVRMRAILNQAQAVPSILDFGMGQ